MIYSDYRFSSVNGRLKVLGDFIPDGAPTIRKHNIFIGLFLCIFQKAVYISGKNEKGESDFWCINKNSYHKLKKKLTATYFTDKDIDGLLDSVKANYELQKKKKAQDNKPVPPPPSKPLVPKDPPPADDKKPAVTPDSNADKVPPVNPASNADKLPPVKDEIPIIPLKKDEVPVATNNKQPENPAPKEDASPTPIKDEQPQTLAEQNLPKEEPKDKPKLALSDAEAEIFEKNACDGKTNWNNDQLKLVLDRPILLLSLLRKDKIRSDKFFQTKECLLTLMRANFFDKEFFADLPYVYRSPLISFIKSNIKFINEIEIDEKEKEEFNKFFSFCIYVTYQIDDDPKFAVGFLEQFAAHPLFASAFFAMSNDELLHGIEKRFTAAGNLSVFDKQTTPNIELLGHLITLIETGNTSNQSKQGIVEMLLPIKKVLTWIALPPGINDIKDPNDQAFALILVNHMLEKLKDKKISNSKISKFLKDYEVCSEILKSLPSLLFPETPKEKVGDAQYFYKGRPELVQKYLDCLVQATDVEKRKIALKEFIDFHDYLLQEPPGAFAFMLPKIQTKELLLEILKIVNGPKVSEKEILLGGLAGGMAYKTGESPYKVSLTTEQIKAAFDEAGLSEFYQEETVDCLSLSRFKKFANQ